MSILTQLIEIIILRRRPQDLAFDQLSVVLYLVIATGLNYIAMAYSGAFSKPILISCIQYGAQALGLFLMLKISGKAERYVQSATAYFGVMAVMTTLSLLSIFVPGLYLMQVFVAGWSFYLGMIILRDAFDASSIRAIFLFLGLNLSATLLTALLVPEYVIEAQAFLTQPVPEN